MKKIIQLFVIYCLSTTNLIAGHPLNTDDAFNVGLSNLEIEIVSEYIIDGQYRELGFPVAVTYGLLHNADLVLSKPFHSTWDDNISLSSFGDILIELKYTIALDFLKLGIKPFATLPTGDTDKGFGKGKAGYGVAFLLTKEWETFHIYKQLGYTRNNNIVDEKLNLWDYSIAVEKFIYEDLSTVFEFGIARNPCLEISGNPRFILGGFIYQINGNVTFDLGLMKGLSNTEVQYSILSGFTVGI